MRHKVENDHFRGNYWNHEIRKAKGKERRRKKRNHGRVIKEVELEEHRVTETKRISRKEKWELLQWSKSMKPNKRQLQSHEYFSKEKIEQFCRGRKKMLYGSRSSEQSLRFWEKKV